MNHINIVTLTKKLEGGVSTEAIVEETSKTFRNYVLSFIKDNYTDNEEEVATELLDGTIEPSSLIIVYGNNECTIQEDNEGIYLNLLN